MARINLLPWRKEQRERRNKEFNLLAGATAGLAILVTILVLSILNRELTNQQNANKHIEDANAQLDVALKSIEELEVKREQMLSQMKVIQDLQGRRSVPVRVWDNIARAIPRDTMYLNNIKREGDVITFTGFAANPNVVANLVRNLNASEWLDGSAVVSIKTKLEAYQSTPSQQLADAGTRSVYPEDSYVEFVATTKIQYQEDKEEATDSTGEDVVLPPVTVDSQVWVLKQCLRFQRLVLITLQLKHLQLQARQSQHLNPPIILHWIQKRLILLIAKIRNLHLQMVAPK